jgi:hypothetical protein
MKKDSMNYEDKTNVNQIVLLLGVSEGAKTDILLNSINAGKTVKIPEREITYYDWRGVGYIVRAPGIKAGYLISGGLSGGGSVVAMNLSSITSTIVNTISAYYKYNALLVEGWPYPFEVCSRYDVCVANLSLFLLGYSPVLMVPRWTTEQPPDEKLLSILKEGKWKIFYFTGHGDEDGLALTKEGLEKKRNGGALEASEIQGGSSLYNFIMVILNSCDSGSPNSEGPNLWGAFGISETSQNKCFLGFNGTKTFLGASLFYTEFWFYSVFYPQKTIKNAIDFASFKFKIGLKIYGNPNITIKE